MVGNNTICYCLGIDIIKLDKIKYVLSLHYHLLNIIIINSLITVKGMSIENYNKLAINSMFGNFKPNLNKREVWFSKSLGVNSCDAYNTFVDYQFCFIL
jgi:hypothetical protein